MFPWASLHTCSSQVPSVHQYGQGQGTQMHPEKEVLLPSQGLGGSQQEGRGLYSEFAVYGSEELHDGQGGTGASLDVEVCHWYNVERRTLGQLARASFVQDAKEASRIGKDSKEDSGAVWPYSM